MDKRIQDILNSNREDILKKLSIMAIVAEEFRKENEELIVVGGQAVEFYTSGGYATDDIDILTEATVEQVQDIFFKLGFEKSNKYWVLENLFIEIPSGPLDGDKNKVIKIRLDKELFINLIGIEDIILDRLSRYSYWGEFSDKEWIISMISNNEKIIDIEYVREKSEKKDLTKILNYFLEIVKLIKTDNYKEYNIADIVELVTKEVRIKDSIEYEDLIKEELDSSERSIIEGNIYIPKRRLKQIILKVKEKYLENEARLDDLLSVGDYDERD